MQPDKKQSNIKVKSVLFLLPKITRIIQEITEIKLQSSHMKNWSNSYKRRLSRLFKTLENMN